MSTFSEKFDRGDYPLLPETDVCRMCEMFARWDAYAEPFPPKERREQKKVNARWHKVHIRVDHKK